MPASNFPQGFPFGLTVRGMTVLNAYPGRVFWVDSNAGADSGKGTFQRPFDTIDYAIGRCTADKGDIIMVKAGHVETITAAAGVALDVGGISIIGLGNKRNRPIIDFTTSAAASFKVTADNIYVENLHFRGSVDALTNPIHVLGSDFEMSNFTIQDVAGTAQAVDWVLTTAAANRMHLHHFEYDGDTAAGTNAGIAIVGGDGHKIHDFVADGNFAVGFIDIRTTATTDLKVFNVMSFRTRNSADIFLIDTITASTETIGPNLYLRLQDNAANITEACTGATFVYFQPISIVNNAGESSMFTNITASTDA